MLMATPLGQTVTPQEVSVELRERGYYPLPVSPPAPVSPVAYDLIPGLVSPPVTLPDEGTWITDRYPPGYDPVVTPVSPPALVDYDLPDLPVTPEIYKEFITRPAPALQIVEERIRVEPPVSPPYDVIFPEPPLDLPPLEPELPYSPPPGFIIQEFPLILPDFQMPFEPLPEWEIIPPEMEPISPPVSPVLPVPVEKPKTWILIAVLGGALLLSGDREKPVEKRTAERKEQWT